MPSTLNLVYALHKQRRLGTGSAVAVIGGGAAGITAAADAALGCNVTLLEKGDVLLPTLRGNHTRWIHRTCMTWPCEGSERLEAGLPLLDWKAALAHEVPDQLDNAWHALRKRGHITVHHNVTSIHPRAGRVSWNTDRFQDREFAAANATGEDNPRAFVWTGLTANLVKTSSGFSMTELSRSSGACHRLRRWTRSPAWSSHSSRSTRWPSYAFLRRRTHELPRLPAHREGPEGAS